jgi:predicted transcriptional regulator of viral defense system
MKKSNRLSASQFIEELQGQGRYTFVREEARKKLRVTSWAAYLALRRLIKAKHLVMPRSGFYIIVNAEHRVVGTLPPEWFIHDLMENMGKPYYVALLSAAQLHGAAHHQPQVYQVVIPNKSTRPIQSGNVKIRFYGKGLFNSSDLVDVKTPTGLIKASSPETTAWDLVRYSKQAGGLDNVITVLSELSEKLNSKKLLAVVKNHRDLPTAQRLGWLLEKIRKKNLVTNLAEWVEKKNPPTKPLDRTSTVEHANESKKWRLLINADPVAEI